MQRCALFDKYRDGELGDSSRSMFESHLAGCRDCQVRMSLLNNLVCVLKQEKVQPLDLADRIARQAFQPTPSWEVLVVSWFRPRFAAAVFGFILILASFLWLIPMSQPVVAYTEYESLLNEADASNLASKLLVQSDNELVMQLEQEGISE